MSQVVWIVGEKEESTNILVNELNAMGYRHVYEGDEVAFLNGEDKGASPDILFADTGLLAGQDFSGYVKAFYPHIPVIALCAHDELLFALEIVGSKADHYLIRKHEYGEQLKAATSFAAYRTSKPEFYAEQVKWMLAQIPQAILDIAVSIFFVDYEDPDSRINSQVRKAMDMVFGELDQDINLKLMNG